MYGYTMYMDIIMYSMSITWNLNCKVSITRSFTFFGEKNKSFHYKAINLNKMYQYIDLKFYHSQTCENYSTNIL